MSRNLHFSTKNLLIFLIFVNLLNYSQEYMDYPPDFYNNSMDSPFKNDNLDPNEKYHVLIQASAAGPSTSQYIDEYNGIVYKRNILYGFKCCAYTPSVSYRDITDYLKINNINETRLQGLLRYGAAYNTSFTNITISFRQSSSEKDMLLNIRFMLTNTNKDLNITFSIVTCENYNYERCNGMKPLAQDIYMDPFSFIYYTIKFDYDGYYLEHENFTIRHTDYKLTDTNGVLPLYFYTGAAAKDDNPTALLMINAYTVSYEMRRNVLSVVGDQYSTCSSVCPGSHSCENYKPNGETLVTTRCRNDYYYFNTDCSMSGCKPGSFCAPHSVCRPCEYQCRTCHNDGFAGCKSCYQNTIYPQWDYYNTHGTNMNNPGKQCVYEFYMTNKMRNFQVEMPIPKSYRVTMEFWIFVHNGAKLTNSLLEPSLCSIIIKDFMTLSLHMNELDNDDLDLILVPFERSYEFDREYVTREDFKKYKNKYPGLQYARYVAFNVTSNWVFVKCGFSYNHKEMYVGDRYDSTVETLNHLPVFKDDDVSSYNTFQRKFFRKNDKIYMKFQGFEIMNTDVYIRNLHIYDDYLPHLINNPNYFDLYTIDKTTFFPQLLFAIPFRDMTVNEDNRVYFKTYDFSGQYYDSTTTDYDKVIIKEESSVFVRDTIDTLDPLKNFRRLKFLAFNDTFYSTSDLDKQNLPIKKGANDLRVYDDEKPIICRANYNLITKKVDDETVTECTQEGVVDTDKYMRLPNYRVNQNSISKISNNLFNYKCDENVENCPNSYNSNIEDFKCTDDYYTLYYNCYPKEDLPEDKSALQFSGALNTITMEFPFLNPLFNFYIEIWFHPDLLTQAYPPIISTYLLMTDNHIVFYDVEAQKFKFTVYKDDTPETYDLGQKINYYGWSHMILASFYDATADKTHFMVSISNKFEDIVTIEGKITCQKLCFCNNDDCCGRTYVNKWFDLFIQDIKVWDAEFSNPYIINDYEKYGEYIRPGGLIHHYRLTASFLNNNKICDKYNTNLCVVYPFEQTNYFNPDNDMYYNVGFHFSWNDINYPKFIVSSKINTDINRIEVIESNTCDEGCSMCYGSVKFNCYKCNKGYALNNSTCTRRTDGAATFYYLNPLKNVNVDFSLKFSDLDLNNHPALTLFFYIRIYGFDIDVINDYKINGKNKFLLLTLGNNLILYIDKISGNLILELNNKKQFEYPNIERLFGEWVPISMSFFRPSDATLQKTFASMTVSNTILPYLGDPDPTHTGNDVVYELFIIDRFIVDRHVICHLSDVTLYDQYIVNGFGYAMHKEIAPTDINLPAAIIKIFKLYNAYPKSASLDTVSCVDPADVDDPSLLPNIKCTEDYLPYTDNKCKENEFVKFISGTVPPSCEGSSSKCKNINQVIEAMKNNKCDYKLASCDNKSDNSIRNLIFSHSVDGEFIVCGPANGLDLARFNEAKIEGKIISPTDEYKMEFWFLTQSYIPNKFGKFYIDWEKHMKIEASYNPAINKFGAKCTPYNNPYLNFDYNEASNDENRWRYIVCGVSNTEAKAYLSNLMPQNRRESSISPQSISENKVSISFKEESVTNFGVVYIKELRLWSCFDCFSDKAFMVYERYDPSFERVIHYFKFDRPEGELYDMVTGLEDPDVFVKFTTKPDFNGYGLLNPITDVPDCNEAHARYFSIVTGKGCDLIFNFNNLKKEVVFNELPSAKNNRYTLEFWFYVETADDFTSGMNIIYDEHITISAYTKSISSNDIEVYCFPQAYRDKLYGKFGEGIQDAYDAAQNADKVTINNAFSKWVFARCSYSYDLQKFYLNDNSIKGIEGEIFNNPDGTQNKKNAKSFKYFMKERTKLILNISPDNFVRIFINTINIYRDYIPQNIDTRYIKMTQLITDPKNNPYFPILFAVDFINGFETAKNRILYTVTDYDYDVKAAYYLDKFISYTTEKSYPTYPTYDPFLQCNLGEKYDPASKECVQINDCADKYCLDEGKYFWCEQGKYLDVNTLTCNDDCPNLYTRPSDVIEGYGVCYINAGDMNYVDYPRTNAELLKGTYENKFTCGSNYDLVNYFCVPQNDNNMLYFSSKYRFQNLIAEYKNLYIKNYFVSFWFLFDLTNDDMLNDDTMNGDSERYTIFIAYPHFITRYKSNLQYHNAFESTEYHDLIPISEIKRKWNHLILEFYYSEEEKNKIIKVYLNNKITTPLLNYKTKNGNDFVLSQIAFCHKNNEHSSCYLGKDSSNYKIFNPIWDDIYYKRIMVWNHNSTNILSIANFKPSDPLTMNIIAYYELTTGSIKLDTVKSITTYKGKNLDFLIRYNHENPYDKSSGVNWATNADPTILQPDFGYVTNVENFENSAVFSSKIFKISTDICDPNCKECFTNGPEECISCKNDKILSATKCSEKTNTYLEFQISGLTDDYLIFNTPNLNTLDEATYTFFMRFKGTNDRTGLQPIVCIDADSCLHWNNEEDTFEFHIKDSGDDKTLFIYKKSNQIIDKWSLFTISIKKSDNPGVYPNKIAIMFDAEVLNPLIPIPTLNEMPINFNTFKIYNKIQALFYDIRIYNKFFIGAYSIGMTKVDSALFSAYLLFNFALKGTNNNDCFSSTYITNAVTAYNCHPDVNLYDEGTYDCEDTLLKKINDIEYTGECVECKEYCNVDYKCYNNANDKTCTCPVDSGMFWLRYSNIGEIYCEKINSLNLNEYGPISISGIKPGNKYKYMVEFWFLVYSYMNPENFEGFEITWKNFIKVTVDKENSNLLVKCYPKSEVNIFVQESGYKYNTWNFIRCQVNYETQNVILNEKKENLVDDINGHYETNTILTLRENSPDKFGVTLVRELRLWDNTYTLLEDVSHTDINPNEYDNLKHYFKFYYDAAYYKTSTIRDKIYDKVHEKHYTITPKTAYKYSYIPGDIKELVLCEEGTVLKKNIYGELECQESTNEDILNNLKKDETIYTIGDLKSKTDMVYQMVHKNFTFDYKNTQTRTKINSILPSSDANFTLQISDPKLNDRLCNHQGTPYLVDKTLACHCYSGFIGSNCIVAQLDYQNFEDIFTLFIQKIEGTFEKFVTNKNISPEEKTDFVNSINNLIYGARYFSTTSSFIDVLAESLKSKVVFNIHQCDEDYIKMVDNLYTNIISLTNQYKAAKMATGKGNGRTANISIEQEYEISKNVDIVKSSLEYLTSLCFHKTVEGYWNYNSENINVDLFSIDIHDPEKYYKIDEKIKQLKVKKYESYVQFSNCMEKIKENLRNSQTINIQFITWYNSPYYYSGIINNNYTSDYLEIKVYNDEISEVPISDFSTGSLDFFMSVSNPLLQNIINENLKHFKKENMHDSKDRIFREPKYIRDDGSIDQMSLEDRKKLFYYEYILVFKTFDYKENLLSTTGMNYEDLIEGIYFKCSSSHLSEFLLTYQYNPYPNETVGRLYYLDHLNIFKCAENYYGNMGLYLFAIIFVVYVVVFVVNKVKLCIKLQVYGGKNFKLIEEFLVDYVYPYGNPEGEYFIKKDNLNRIYNEEDNFAMKFDGENKKSDNLLINSAEKLSVKKRNSAEIKIEDVPKEINEEENKENGVENRVEIIDPRKRVEDLDFGNIRNKATYNKFFGTMSKKGVAQEDEKVAQSTENNNIKTECPLKSISNPSKKRKNMDENNNNFISEGDVDKTNILKTSSKLKEKKEKKQNFINSKDEISEKISKYKQNIKFSQNSDSERDDDEEEIQKKNVTRKELLHNLQVYNPDIRMKILLKLDVSAFNFICTNFFNRNIYTSSFKSNYTYSASIRALYLPMQLLLYYFINVFIYVFETEELGFADYFAKKKTKFILFICLSILLVSLFFYGVSYFYNIDGGKIRNLLFYFKTSKKKFDDEYIDVLNCHKIFMIFETLFFIFLLGLTFFFAFGFCAIYEPQAKLMLIAFIFCLIIDLALDLFIEVCLGLVYLGRKNQTLLIVLDCLNRVRSYKMLAP